MSMDTGSEHTTADEVKRKLDFTEDRLNFTGRSFYLDIRRPVLKAKVTKCIRHMQGNVEDFLSRDIHLMVTDKTSEQIDKVISIAKNKSDNCITKSRLANKYSSRVIPHGLNKTTYVESGVTRPDDSRSAISPVNHNTNSLSRGQALLLRARRSLNDANKENIRNTNSVDPIQHALDFGIKIVSAEKFLKKYYPRIYSKNHIKTDPASSLMSWTSSFAQTLKGQSFKLEDDSLLYRPLFLQTRSFPDIHYDIGLNSPFHPRKEHPKDASPSSAKLNQQKASKKPLNNPAAQSGYCEACDYWYNGTLRHHLSGVTHKKFTEKSKNYENLDAVISKLPDEEEFLSVILKKKSVIFTPVRTSSSSPIDRVELVFRAANLDDQGDGGDTATDDRLSVRVNNIHITSDVSENKPTISNAIPDKLWQHIVSSPTPPPIATSPQTPPPIATSPRTPSLVATSPQTPSPVATSPHTPPPVAISIQTPSAVSATCLQTPQTIITWPETQPRVETSSQSLHLVATALPSALPPVATSSQTSRSVVTVSNDISPVLSASQTASPVDLHSISMTEHDHTTPEPSMALPDVDRVATTDEPKRNPRHQYGEREGETTSCLTKIPFPMIETETLTRTVSLLKQVRTSSFLPSDRRSYVTSSSSPDAIVDIKPPTAVGFADPAIVTQSIRSSDTVIYSPQHQPEMGHQQESLDEDFNFQLTDNTSNIHMSFFAKSDMLKSSDTVIYSPDQYQPLIDDGDFDKAELSQPNYFNQLNFGSVSNGIWQQQGLFYTGNTSSLFDGQTLSGSLGNSSEHFVNDGNDTNLHSSVILDVQCPPVINQTEQVPVSFQGLFHTSSVSHSHNTTTQPSVARPHGPLNMHPISYHKTLYFQHPFPSEYSQRIRNSLQSSVSSQGEHSLHKIYQDTQRQSGSSIREPGRAQHASVSHDGVTFQRDLGHNVSNGYGITTNSLQNVASGFNFSSSQSVSQEQFNFRSFENLANANQMKSHCESFTNGSFYHPAYVKENVLQPSMDHQCVTNPAVSVNQHSLITPFCHSNPCENISIHHEQQDYAQLDHRSTQSGPVNPSPRHSINISQTYTTSWNPPDLVCEETQHPFSQPDKYTRGERVCISNTLYNDGLKMAAISNATSQMPLNTSRVRHCSDIPELGYYGNVSTDNSSQMLDRSTAGMRLPPGISCLQSDSSNSMKEVSGQIQNASSKPFRRPCLLHKRLEHVTLNSPMVVNHSVSGAYKKGVATPQDNSITRTSRSRKSKSLAQFKLSNTPARITKFVSTSGKTTLVGEIARETIPAANASREISDDHIVSAPRTPGELRVKFIRRDDTNWEASSPSLCRNTADIISNKSTKSSGRKRSRQTDMLTIDRISSKPRRNTKKRKTNQKPKPITSNTSDLRNYWRVTKSGDCKLLFTSKMTVGRKRVRQRINFSDSATDISIEDGLEPSSKRPKTLNPLQFGTTI